MVDDYKLIKRGEVANWQNDLVFWGEDRFQPGRYVIRWDDGAETSEDVLIERTHYRGMEMGHQTFEVREDVYVMIDIHGRKQRVDVVGLMAKAAANG